MKVTLKPDPQTVTHLWAIIAPRNSIWRMTRLSPVFHVRVWLRETRNNYNTTAIAQWQMIGVL